METSIRFVRVNGRAVKPALCFRGRNQVHAVVNEPTVIRVVSNIPLAEYDRAVIVLGPYGLGHREYPVDQFCKRFLGMEKPMTARARFMLEKALEGGLEDTASLPPDTLPGGGGTDSGRQVSEAPVGAPQSVPRSSAAPKPGKPRSEPLRKPGGTSGAVRTAGADVIRTIAAELKLEPTKLRKLLRSKGLSAPYTDEKLIRSKL